MADNDNEVIHIEDDDGDGGISNLEEHPIIVNREVSTDENLYGIIVSSEEEAYNLYMEYGIRTGFSVRIDQRRKINKVVRQVNYCCSKEGFKVDGDPSEEKKTHRLETRCGCLARIRFGLQDNNLWKVTLFISEHNHRLATPEERQHLRCNRKVSEAHKGVIRSMKSAGMGTGSTYSYLSEEVGGSQNVGFTKTDCYNFVSRERMIMLEAGDAQSLINLFKKKQIEDPMFFYTVQVDQENRMTNFFWRDGKSKTDFECFGDVVVFDTTYRTNKYNMICAPFVGVNHHWKNVLFGCAFLLDETTASFIWLFETFLEAMDGKKPKTIFTDRCQAMANAIEKVLPESRHRLCLWHISKNAVQNLSFMKDTEFSELFNKFVFGRVTEDEFESTWSEIIGNFDHTEKEITWLNTLYDLREKWCALFSKDTFSADILSTQRSESTNNVFTNMSTKTMSLTEFVHQYDKQAEQMRSSELEETFRCNNGIHPRAAKSSGIKKQAGMVYTRKIYNLFEFEFVACLEVTMEEVGSDGTMQKFELNQDGRKRVYTVQFDSSTLTISCSCKMYESKGWLCRHALRVLNVKNVSKIPAQYILKRWTKDAKKGVEENNVQVQIKEKFTVTLRRNSLMRKAYGIISKAAETTSGGDIALLKLIEAEELIDKNIKKLSIGGDADEQVNEGPDVNSSSAGGNRNETLFDEPPILNPAGVWPKGMSNKRMKAAMEKKQNKKAPKGRGSGKVKPPNNGAPSQASLPIGAVVHNSSLLHQFEASSGTYPINQHCLYAPYTLYNQNPTSVSPFSQHNLTYANMPQANMQQADIYLTQFNQVVLQSDRKISPIEKSSVCSIQSLETLALNDNQLSGELPKEWMMWSNIQIVDVSNNNLSGTIPSSMGIPSSLVILKADNNQLSGEIPHALQNCSFLDRLYLGGNKLSGSIPSWIGSRIKVLQLRSNSLSGHIPHHLCTLRSLQILDLRHNRFSGTIPNCLNNLTTLVSGPGGYGWGTYTHYEQTTVTTKGRESEYSIHNEMLLTFIDLSSNDLQGEIPEELSGLFSLGTLNLSMNHLSGSIPSNIGKLHWLETLDLSQNQLSGHIPQSLSNLTFLSHVNLSHNKLTGRIPSGYQLQTLDDASIYEGNSLCGFPLPKCPEDGDTMPEPHVDDGDDEEKLGFYTSAALGFIIGFWSVCGTLILKKSWRYAYFQFFDHIKDKVALAIALRAVRFQRRS